MSNRYEGGDLLVDALRRLGVRQIFTVSGGPLNSLYHAAANHGLPLVHVRHESAACHMADAVARISGTPGVAAVTLGPAVTNAMTGAMMASMAGVPILIIGGQSGTRTFDTGTDMSIDALPIMRPLTKLSARVLHTERIPEYVEMAWRAMWAGRPGPAFLEIPVDVLSAPAQPLQRAPAACARVPGLRAADARAIAEALAAARRPLLLIGDEARWEMRDGLAPAAVRDVVERHALPFSCLRLARGIVDERHALSLGPCDVFANPVLKELLGEADLVLLLGHHFEFAADFGAPIRSDAITAQVYGDAAYVGHGRAPTVSAVSGVAPVVDLLGTLPPRTEDETWTARATSAWREQWSTLYGARADEEPLHPATAVHAVMAAMPPETIYVTGHGNVDYWADTVIRVPHANGYIRGGLGGAVGPEVPYGIGARFAEPHRPVVVFVGDGAVGYHGSELDTAERYARPVILVVLDDRKWGAIALPQRRNYGAEYEMDLRERDWPGFARSLGAAGWRAESAAAVREAAARALAAGRPALIHVPVQCVISPFMDAFGF